MTILMIGVCGCNLGTNNNPSSENTQNTEDNVILSERQMKILSEQDLSTDYDKLEKHQQEAIVAIEELLKHLEDKYEIGFTYLGYNAEGVLEDEKLIAYPTDGDDELDIVEAIRKSGEITDNYIDVAARPILNKAATDYTSQFVDAKDFRVYTTTPLTTIKSLPIDSSDLSGNIYGGSDIFIGADSIKKDDFEEFTNKFGDWLKENRFYGSNDLILIESSSIDYLTEYNYQDNLASEKCLLKMYYILHKNGDTTISEWYYCKLYETNFF